MRNNLSTAVIFLLVFGILFLVYFSSQGDAELPETVEQKTDKNTLMSSIKSFPDSAKNSQKSESIKRRLRVDPNKNKDLTEETQQNLKKVVENFKFKGNLLELFPVLEIESGLKVEYLNADSKGVTIDESRQVPHREISDVASTNFSNTSISQILRYSSISYNLDFKIDFENGKVTFAEKNIVIHEIEERKYPLLEELLSLKSPGLSKESVMKMLKENHLTFDPAGTGVAFENNNLLFKHTESGHKSLENFEKRLENPQSTFVEDGKLYVIHHKSLKEMVQWQTTKNKDLIEGDIVEAEGYIKGKN